ncbi:hypothetical protein BCU68_06670 [Vibrio sp. 10N.286.49.B3]|uniref:DUF721 domain-containing protein n=1 Tax=Vibrio sp. 10N.286.49.B3 TaxID=1880855 RepID=UPI000C8382B9|nr:DciA family protein [Vibrio sp. 10N.286.49.B3]PMH39779.1 hypothetical protein BCU68_06670 [Vibrio sp. 10N.286.49.B3]
MRDHRPTLTNELLSDSRWSELQKHASEINEINHALEKILPRGTAHHCRAANLRGGNLIIDVASAAIKMKIDYDRLMILNQLRTVGFARLISIEVRINPSLYKSISTAEKKKAPEPRQPLSAAAAESLLITAEMAPPKIKARLERIAQLAKSRSSD